MESFLGSGLGEGLLEEGREVFKKFSEDKTRKLKILLKEMESEAQYLIQGQSKAVDDIFVKISKIAQKWSYEKLDLPWEEVEKIISEGEKASGKLVEWVQSHITKDLLTQNITEILGSKILPPPPPVAKQLSQVLAEVIRNEFDVSKWSSSFEKHKQLYWFYLKTLSTLAKADQVLDVYESIMQKAKSSLIEFVEEKVESFLGEISYIGEGLELLLTEVKTTLEGWKKTVEAFFVKELAKLKAGATSILKYIEELKEDAKKFLKQVFTKIGQVVNIKNLEEKIKKIIGDFEEKVKSLIEKIRKELFQNFNEKIKPFYSQLENKIKEVWNDYKDVKPEWGSPPKMELGEGLGGLL